MKLTIDEKLDYMFDVYPRNTRRWFNKILSQMYQHPVFPEIENELALREAEEKDHLEAQYT